MKLKYSKQEKNCHEEYLTNLLLWYLRVKKIGFFECPFNWWSKNENWFPIF